MRTTHHLCLLLVVVGDLEILELVCGGAGGHNMQEITKLLLLKELLSQVLKVSLGEGKLGSDVKLGLLSGDGHLGAKVACEKIQYDMRTRHTYRVVGFDCKLTGLAVDLNAIMQELFEGDRVQDLILHRLPAVNGELSDILLRCLLVSFLQVTKHINC